MVLVEQLVGRVPPLPEVPPQTRILVQVILHELWQFTAALWLELTWQDFLDLCETHEIGFL